MGWAMRFGPEIAPGMAAAEREDYGQAVLSQRLRDALARLNPKAPPAALDEAYRKLTRPDRSTLTAVNHAAHPTCSSRACRWGTSVSTARWAAT